MGLHCRAGLALALQTHLHVGGLKAANLSHRRMAQGVRWILHTKKGCPWPQVCVTIPLSSSANNCFSLNETLYGQVLRLSSVFKLAP